MPISPEARPECRELFYIFDWEFLGLGQKIVKPIKFFVLGSMTLVLKYQYWVYKIRIETILEF